MRYFLKQAWFNIRGNWGLFLQTLSMMAVSFLILGVFGGIALQLQQILNDWEGEAPVLLYLKEDISPTQRHKIKTFLQKEPSIAKVIYVSPEQAMQRFRRSLGKKDSLLKGLDAPLFPPSFELVLHEMPEKNHFLQNLGKRLQKLQGVKEIDYGREWIAPLWALARWIRGIFWGGGLLLLLGASLMASGTIRLNLLLHRDEIEIMRLVGATELFIQMPFYIEGILEGIGAALFSLFVLLLFYFLLQHYYGEAFLIFTSHPLRFFSFFQMLLFLFGGFLAGVGGSWIALHFNSSYNQSL